METPTIKMKKRPQVIDTLLQIQKGQTYDVKVTDCKASSIRSAVRNLNNKGYSYTATEKGLTDRIRVTRIK